MKKSGVVTFTPNPATKPRELIIAELQLEVHQANGCRARQCALYGGSMLTPQILRGLQAAAELERMGIQS